MKKMEPELRYIPLSFIKPNPYQPRREFNKKSLEELSQSIKSYGVIQPISIRQIKPDSYELIAGERRLRASKMAELEEIPALIVEYRDSESAIISLVENLQREDLNFIEEAEGYNNLIVDHGFTQQEIATKIGKSQSTIANKLRLLKLPEEIKRSLLENELTERHGRALLKLSDNDLKEKILKKVIKDELNVKRTENLVARILDDLTKTETDEGKQNIKSMINIRIYLNTIKQAYSAIKDSGIDAEYKEVDKGDYVEVLVKIPKGK
ncbi:MAG TPA: nucleoid occlusion protein [Tissierellaceae bacterium]|nr:nucleoid occlusion protein [Tissierellaceae bacterium]